MPQINLTTTTGTKGKEFSLPDSLFGAKVNPVLMAQAVRVFLNNQRQAGAKTKHRGKVDLTKKKVYRQKGTGNARHGAQSAPLFVGGGVAHGLEGFQNYQLTMPRKMRQRSLASALSWKLKEAQIRVVDALLKVEPKVKAAGEILQKLELANKKVTVILPKRTDESRRTWGNLGNVHLLYADVLNTYDVLNGGVLVISPESINVMEKTYSTLSEVKKTTHKVTAANAVKEEKAEVKVAAKVKTEKPVKKTAPIAKKIVTKKATIKKKSVKKASKA